MCARTGSSLSGGGKIRFYKVNGSTLHVEATSADIYYRPTSDLAGLHRKNVGLRFYTFDFQALTRPKEDYGARFQGSWRPALR